MIKPDLKGRTELRRKAKRLYRIGLRAIAAVLGLVQPLMVRWPLRGLYGPWAARLLEDAGSLQPEFYLKENPEAGRSGGKLSIHYLVHGTRSGFNACELFDRRHYRLQMSSFFERRMEPLLHYHLIGKRLQLDPHPWFRTEFYIKKNFNIRQVHINPLGHYLLHGWQEGRAPCPEFDPSLYLALYPDVARSRENPLLHYLHKGRFEDRLGGASGEAANSRIHKPSEEEWAQLSRRSRSDDPVVDVVVPVYGNPELTLRCLYSVLVAKVTTPYELVVVNDASPDATLAAELRDLAGRLGFTLLENEQNRGFVHSANLGLALHHDRDVVLLNSDTEVYDGWLDRLWAAAWRHPRTASVTPFSNNATVCSYPVFNSENSLPLELSYRELDALAAEANAEKEIELPTSVGFCLYLRRDCLDEIGLLDEAAFGRGYGEENDLSMRATKRGWRNILAADVFVRHWGSVSFGAEKAALQAAATKVLLRRHPEYFWLVRRYAAEDPPRELRAALDRARLRHWAASAKDVLLLISHNRGGGTEQHIEAVIAEAEAAGRAVLRLFPAQEGSAKVRLLPSRFGALPNLGSFDLDQNLDALAELLRELAVSEIQVHSLIDLIPEAPERIASLAQMCGTQLFCIIHDYVSICPRINLVAGGGLYCGEPTDPDACDACLAANGSSFGTQTIRPWRERYGRLLRQSIVRVPDEDVSHRLSRYFTDLDFEVRPHDVVEHLPASSELTCEKPPERVATVAVLGAISEIKGYHVLAACAKDAQRRGLPIRFVLIGYSIGDRKLRRYSIEVTGQYRNDEVHELICNVAPDVIWLPSVWPETYCYALSLALKTQYQIAAFDLGSIAARLKRLGLDDGLMPLSLARDPAAINQRLIALGHRAQN